MATHRSPNYPQYGLNEAADMVRLVYEKEKRSQSSGEIVAKALGYSSLSGNARAKIGSLKQYGLLEGDERKGMRVTDLAMQMLYPSSGLEHADALKKAAINPPLFRSILEEKSGASDDSIVNYLVSKLDFHPGGAAQAVASYRDAMEVSGLSHFGYNEQKTPELVEAQPMHTETRSASAQLADPQIVAHGKPGNWNWPLSVPRGVNAQLVLTGDFRKADITRLKKQIELLEESFDEEG